jgi:dual specificity protein kinase YAK1
MEEEKVTEQRHHTGNIRMARSEGNYLKRLTMLILDTYKSCDTRFEYAPGHMNPRRDLTYPSEGVYNNGYDNIDCDYILRVSDLIITPEERE